MKRLVCTIIIFGLSLFILPAADTDIMKLSEIRVGMEGEGKTIFKGSTIETFKFKVLGVIEKFVPDKNLIIVELEAPELEESGIIAGMSGSPVYIGGKIIGAVAYGFPYSKRPIGGVTPIEDIIEVDNHNQPPYTIDISNVKVQFDEKNIQSIKDLLQKELSRRINFTPHQSLSPIRLIGVHKGMDPDALSYLSPIFSPAAGLKVRGRQGTGTKDVKGNVKNVRDNVKNVRVNRRLFDLSPADAAAVPLIRGDFEYSASGTVTYVKGNKVYLFGHPFFNLGTVSFPLHKAEVISVVPSYQSPFKLAATRHQVGTVVQDRFSSIQAELGKTPYMIPMKVFLENRNRSFNFEMANHPLLTPALSNIALGNIFVSEYKQFGFQSLRVKGTVFIENERNVIMDDLFSGPNAAAELGNLLLAVNFFLMNNRDKPIKIQKIDFNISGSERLRNASIENVIVGKRAYYPGELMDVVIQLKNERGGRTAERLQIKAPNLKAGSTFHLLVADKAEIVRFDTKNIKTAYFPLKLNNLIRAINNLRKNNRIYLKLVTPTDGVFIKGHEYSNLPGGLRNVLEYNTVSGDQSRMKYSTVMEYQVEVPTVVTGSKRFILKIKERSDVQ